LTTARTSLGTSCGASIFLLREVIDMVKKDSFYFEDLDIITQEIIIALIASIIENKQNNKNEQKQEDN